MQFTLVYEQCIKSQFRYRIENIKGHLETSFSYLINHSATISATNARTLDFMRVSADFDTLLAPYEHYAAARGGNPVEDGELQGGARADVDHGEYLLARDQDGR